MRTEEEQFFFILSVDQDRVNWFLYDFELKSDLLKDQEFMKTFKTCVSLMNASLFSNHFSIIDFSSGLIHNIAKKYNLKTSQITVSKVEPTGSTSFQIMPYYDENMDDFQDKIDQIDSDVWRKKRKRVSLFTCVFI